MAVLPIGSHDSMGCSWRLCRLFGVGMKVLGLVCRVAFWVEVLVSGRLSCFVHVSLRVLLFGEMLLCRFWRCMSCGCLCLCGGWLDVLDFFSGVRVSELSKFCVELSSSKARGQNSRLAFDGQSYAVQLSLAALDSLRGRFSEDRCR